jgi:hypothetical protein
VADARDNFFVGYLPPRPMRRWVAGAGAIGVLVIASLLALAQRDPGDATWDLSKQTEFAGELLAKPYPMLRISKPDGSIMTLLLVGEGKVGADDLISRFDGQHVRLKGHLLQRPVRSMLELSDAPDAVAPLNPAAPMATRASSSTPQRVTLRGEIVDPKCFLGAMKPGDGKTHKACATLCIRGGIPPVLMSVDERGALKDYLIVPDSLDAMLPYIADAVEVSGDVVETADLRIFCLKVATVRRVE